MLDSFTNAIDEIPHGYLVFALAAAIVLLQAVVLVLAWKRRPAPALRLHGVSGLTIVILPVMAGLCVHSARITMLSAIGTAEPSEKAAALSAGISGQLNTIPFVTTALLAALALWVAGFEIAREARPASQRPGWPPAALVALGLLAVAVGILQWSIFTIHTFASMAGIDPEPKMVLLRKALDFSHEHLALFALASRVTIVGLAVIAAVLVLVDGGATPMTGRSARRHALASFAALAFAGLLFLAARPMRAENELPWPPPSPGDDVLLVVDPPTPDLVGPDPVERAPVVQVFVDRLELDGSPCSFDSLEDKLLTLRTNYQLLHPGESFNGRAVIVADGAVGAAVFDAVLDKIHAADYLHPLFAFTKPETLVRPLLGTLHRVRASGIQTTVIDRFDVEAAHDPRGGGPGTLLRVRDFPRYEPLARRMLAVRQAGDAVVLKLGK